MQALSLTDDVVARTLRTQAAGAEGHLDLMGTWGGRHQAVDALLGGPGSAARAVEEYRDACINDERRAAFVADSQLRLLRLCRLGTGDRLDRDRGDGLTLRAGCRPGQPAHDEPRRRDARRASQCTPSVHEMPLSFDATSPPSRVDAQAIEKTYRLTRSGSISWILGLVRAETAVDLEAALRRLGYDAFR